MQRYVARIGIGLLSLWCGAGVGSALAQAAAAPICAGRPPTYEGWSAVTFRLTVQASLMDYTDTGALVPCADVAQFAVGTGVYYLEPDPTGHLARVLIQSPTKGWIEGYFQLKDLERLRDAASVIPVLTPSKSCTPTQLGTGFTRSEPIPSDENGVWALACLEPGEFVNIRAMNHSQSYAKTYVTNQCVNAGGQPMFTVVSCVGPYDSKAEYAAPIGMSRMEALIARHIWGACSTDRDRAAVNAILLCEAKSGCPCEGF